MVPSVHTLLSTTANSLGQPIGYPSEGKPEVTALLIEMTAGEETCWHYHPVPLLGYILAGELTVYQSTGEKRIARTGEVSLEAVNIIHKGVNEGTAPCKMIVFVLGQKDAPYTIPAQPQIMR